MPETVYRLKDVMRLTGWKRITIYRKMLLGEFPKDYPISDRERGWRKTDIDEWYAAWIRWKDEVTGYNAARERRKRKKENK